MLFAIYRAYNGWFSDKSFSKFDKSVRLITSTIAHIQLGVGLCLYFISPIIDYFSHNYKGAVKVEEIRFFGIEHSLMMLIAVIIITIGSVKVKNKSKDSEKFRAMAYLVYNRTSCNPHIYSVAIFTFSNQTIF